MDKKIHIKDLKVQDIEKKIKNKEKDPFIPLYHITPPFGLLNDPNGLFIKGGVVHIYYQWYPGFLPSILRLFLRLFLHRFLFRSLFHHRLINPS